MVYLACIVSIISMVKAKNKQFQYFSDIFQTFPEYFQFFLHAPDWLIIMEYCICFIGYP